MKKLWAQALASPDGGRRRVIEAESSRLPRADCEFSEPPDRVEKESRRLAQKNLQHALIKTNT